MQFSEVAQKRRSVRAFTSAPVERDKLETILENGKARKGGTYGRDRSDLPSTIGSRVHHGGRGARAHRRSRVCGGSSAERNEPPALGIHHNRGRTTLSQFSERAKRHLLETMTPDWPIFPLSRPAVGFLIRYLLWGASADCDRRDVRCGSIRRGLLPGGAKPDARRARYGPRHLLHWLCAPLAHSG